MPRKIVPLASDENGNIFMNAASPPEVYLETNPPHGVGIKTSLEVIGGETVETWIVVQRKDAFRLVQRLSDRLAEATQNGAEEITSTLRCERVLNGGAVGDTGRIVLLFMGQSGLKHRVELPSDQSGPLTDFVEMAARRASEIADRTMSEAHGGIVPTELRPLDADLIRLLFDPLTGREFLNIRLPNSLEYSFALSAEQAQQLRQSQAPQVNPAGQMPH